VAAASDCDDTDGDVGAQAERPCETECGTGTEQCEHGEWQPCDAPTSCGTCEDGGVCEPGAIEEAGSCGTCGTMKRQCTTDCTWGAYQCVECDEAVCEIVGGCGAELERRTTDRSMCEQLCAAEAGEHPNRKCTFGNDVFRDYPIDTCLIEGGCAAELYNQQTDSCTCLMECSERSGSHPNRRCVFGSDQVLRDYPIDRCLIEGGCGDSIYEDQTDSCTCLQQCNSYPDREHRSCLFGGDQLLRQKPTANCHIENESDQVLFDQTTIHCDCLRECQDREDSHPNRSCTWDGEAIPEPWGAGM
jgi:hypothetical protein